MNYEKMTKAELIRAIKDLQHTIASKGPEGPLTPGKNKKVLDKTLKDSRQREAEITALLEGAKTVLEYQEFNKTARALFDSCKKLLGASAGYVALSSADEVENKLLFLDSGGLPCSVDPNLPMPIRGMRGEVYRSGRTAYDNTFNESQWATLLPEGHSRLDNVLFAPLSIKGKVLGLLGLSNKPGGFTENDARLASAFGELAAVALLNSRTFQSLEESEERFRSVAQTANDAILSADQEGKIVFWNQAAEKVFGYLPEEVLGKALTLNIPERLRERHRAGMNRVLLTGESQLIGKTVEQVGLRKDGTEFPIELSLSSWKTGEGNFFTAIIRDITERKKTEVSIQRAKDELEKRVKERTADLVLVNKRLREVIKEHRRTQKALEESERKFRAIFNQTFQLSGLLSPDGTILEINQTAIDFLGFDYTDGLGRLLWDLPWKVPNPEILEKGKAAIAEAAEGRFVRHEGSVIDPDGKERTLDYSLKPVFDEVGQVIWLIAEGRDISERKAVEQALLESEKQLRRLSSQVLTAQEIERKRVSKELHDGIGQYLSAVKYKVEDALHRLSEKKGPENDMDRLKTIIPVLQGAIEEVRRICMDLRPSILDDLGILATISWFCREFKQTYGTIRILKHIEIEEQEIPTALRTTIYRIIQEAFNNIAKHSRAGRVNLSLSKTKGAIELVIRDNGQGFELKDRSSEDPSLKGLGLASMKERAEFSGGTLTIESVKGAGTTIRAIWPEPF